MTKKTKAEQIKLGSKTAKDGFKNENFVVSEFNNYQASTLAKSWLKAMDYKLSDIRSINAQKVSGYKTDVQVEITTKTKTKKENLQVKLVSNQSGFNQIDKRWLSKYETMWDIPKPVLRLLMHFTGETAPKHNATKNKKRMFIDEFKPAEQKLILDFFITNKKKILNDIFSGEGDMKATWMLVIVKPKTTGEIKTVVKKMSEVVKKFSTGEVSLSPQGSLKLGSITVQRKGGDNGRPTANMLQFKINPSTLLDD